MTASLEQSRQKFLGHGLPFVNLFFLVLQSYVASMFPANQREGCLLQNKKYLTLKKVYSTKLTTSMGRMGLLLTAQFINYETYF